MSYLSKIKRIATGTGVGAVATAGHEVLLTAVGAGSSYGFGYLQNAYRKGDKPVGLFGVPVEALVGGGMKLLSLGLDMYDKAPGFSPYIREIGTAGVNAYFHTLGASAGSAKSGMKRVLLPAHADVGKVLAAAPGATVVEGLPPAPHGDFLSASELAAWASK